MPSPPSKAAWRTPRGIAGWVALLAAASPDTAEGAPPPAPGCADVDGDGLCAVAEDLDDDGRLDHGETDPHLPDTDGDGTPDGVERDRGTDPARNGYLELPEPMWFDMVRGLGAQRGEVEVNVLAYAALQARAAIDWAPEAEWAFADGQALELELGLENATLEVIKGAYQGTVFLRERVAHAHGVQVLVEYVIDGQILEPVLLHVMGVRLAHAWSFVTLVGARVLVPLSGGSDDGGDDGASARLVANASLFAALVPRVTAGLEANVELGRGFGLVRVLPQVHWQIDHRARLQAGVGLLWTGSRPAAEAAARFIVEL